MNKPYIALQPSESVLVQAAATIYAGYVVAGRVEDADTDEWLQRSIREALKLARTVDENVMADDELD